MNMNENKTVELYLVSGFLGSGKTTFLQNILKSVDTSRVGVIVNEYGSVSIDGKLIGDEELKMVEINNGSIFCACIKGGFVKTLAAFLQQPVDRLYVEASGMADPSSIEDLLQELEPLIEKKYHTDRRYSYKGCVCIVDAGHFIALSSSILPPVKQVQKCNLVVVNKADTVTEKGLGMVHDCIRRIRPDVKIYDTTYSQVPLEVLHQALTGEGDWESVTMNLPTNRPFGGVISLPEVCKYENMEHFLELIGEKMYRVKGFFTDGNTWLVSNVGGDIQIKPDKSRRKRTNQLVVITQYEEGLEQWLKEKWMLCFDTAFEFEEE